MPLNHILNLSWQQGVVPVELKIAKIIPFFHPLFVNYRLISIPPVIANCLKNLSIKDCWAIWRGIISYFLIDMGLERTTLLPWMSLILSYLSFKINEARGWKECTYGIFLDLSKAFYTVSHSALLHKLANLGVGKSALLWFSSYLKDRKQFISFNDIISSLCSITCGV